MKRWCLGFAVLLGPLLTLGACKDPPPPKTGDWTDNIKPAGTGSPDSDDDDEPEVDPEPEPQPTGSADPAPAPTPKPTAKPGPKPGGRPLIQYGPKAAIESTFGSTPGSKLMLTGGITLVLPEFALDAAYNISWKVAPSNAHKKAPVVGAHAVLRIAAGTKLRAQKVKSRGGPFEIRLQTGGKETLNLAVGSVDTDDQGAETGKPTWAVIAPTRVDKEVSVVDGAEKEDFTALFTLTVIGPVMYLHGTTADPSGP